MRAMVGLALAMAATSSVAVEVYRSVAADGTVIYSDRPSGNDAVPVFVATRRVDAPPAPPAAASRPAQQNTEAAQADAETGPTAAQIAEQRERNCATARDRVERYNMSHRLFRTLPNGDREYLDDAEVDRARAQAAADVETWCS